MSPSQDNGGISPSVNGLGPAGTEEPGRKRGRPQRLGGAQTWEARDDSGLSSADASVSVRVKAARHGKPEDDGSPAAIAPAASGLGGGGTAAARAAAHLAAGEERPLEVELDIPSHAVGRIIGKGGSTIKALSASSGATVRVSPEVVGAATTRVTISGSTRAVRAAAGLIDAIVSEVATPVAVTRRVLDCAPERIGLIIGRKGCVVRALQALSGASVDVVELETGATVTVSGRTERAVATAVAAVEGLLGLDDRGDAHAYADSIVSAAADLARWHQERANADAAAASGPGGGESAASAAASISANWREVSSTHPDGTSILYWLNTATGAASWVRPW